MKGVVWCRPSRGSAARACSSESAATVRAVGSRVLGRIKLSSIGPGAPVESGQTVVTASGGAAAGIVTDPERVARERMTIHCGGNTGLHVSCVRWQRAPRVSNPTDRLVRSRLSGCWGGGACQARVACHRRAAGGLGAVAGWRGGRVVARTTERGTCVPCRSQAIEQMNPAGTRACTRPAGDPLSRPRKAGLRSRVCTVAGWRSAE